MYDFPKPYNPLPGESLKDTLIRDGYPQHEIDAGMDKYVRFIGRREMSKSYKGKISDWKIHTINSERYITGVFVDHPIFSGNYGHTSQIVNMKDSDGYWDIETLNSRYRLNYDEERADIRIVI